MGGHWTNIILNFNKTCLVASCSFKVINMPCGVLIWDVQSVLYSETFQFHLLEILNYVNYAWIL